jgi:DNA-directed RNA polymerase II subunit RPB2
MPHKHPGGVSYRDCSIAVKNNECGFVDMNCHDDNRFPTCSNDCYKLCKVRLRSTRVPTVGDKFSSRHGQKGTVGALRKHEDMPFTADGVVPDIIINPHAIPSRMTIGQLMECVLGKVCCMSAVYGDATPFDDRNPGVEDIGAALEDFGLQRHGNEVMVDGLTGAVMTAHVFVGPTFYQRLKHMTTDKCHARAANGPVTSLVRQPAEGRARDGGLRLGEMEVDCLVSHGISHFLKERMMEASDNYRIFVCNDCGMLATYNPSGDVRFCAPCRNTTNFSELRVPYAFKLLTQEIETMGVGVKYATGNQFGLVRQHAG